MISKAQIKFTRSLHQKKFRDESKLFIAEGPKVVSDLLTAGFRAKEVYSVEPIAVPDSVAVTEISEKELAAISMFETPNRTVGIFEMRFPALHVPALKKELIIALDDIRDPGNMGTLLRIADWFGITSVLCSESCVDLYNPKVVQSSMGSLARVKVHYVDLSVTLSELHPVYGTVMQGKNIYKEKLSGKGVILIGNESRGISENLLKQVTHKIAIPNFSSGADSLNAAVACAIVCSEFRRRD